MICPICRKSCMSIHGHHKLPDTVVWRRLYGKNNKFDGYDWLNHSDNKQPAGDCCNTGHNGRGQGLIEWNEKEFCNHFGIEPRSKTSRIKEIKNG